MDYFRTLVSGDKKREKGDNVSLDLTYITPRLIAMAYPASGIESTYRNPINAVANFLNTKHSHHYLLVNLSGRQYDYSKFNFQVIEYDWINHQAPPLHLLFEICLKMLNYLKKDIQNVISVNCLGGKGRTGTIICCFLLFTGVCKTVEESLAYYARKRFVKGGGVTQPSQKRFIQYFYEIISKDIKYPYSIEINRIIVSQLPAYYKGKNTLSIDMLLNYKDKIPVLNEGLKFIPENLNNVVLTPKSFCMVVCGDVSFKIASTSIIKKTTIGRVVFNTAFLPIKKSRIRFTLDQIDPDRLVKDSSYPRGFSIDVEYSRICNCQNDNFVKEQLCPKCSEKNESELKKWEIVNEVVQDYKDKGSWAVFSEGKLALFGNEEDDVKTMLSKDFDNVKQEEEEVEDGGEGGENGKEKKEAEEEEEEEDEKDEESDQVKSEIEIQSDNGVNGTKKKIKKNEKNDKTKQIIVEKDEVDSSTCFIY